MQRVKLTTMLCRTAAVASCVLFTLGLCQTSPGQANELFETTSLEVRLTRQLKLTQNDLRSLRPLMEQESDDLLSLYEYYSDQRISDFESLWNAMRARPEDFASRSTGALTVRQKKALSLARLDFETRILEQWLDDYLEWLNETLELDLVQYKYVQKVFEIEYEQRLEILRKEADGSNRQDEQWRKITENREKALKAVLDESQFRTYRQMKNPPPLIAMRRRVSDLW